MLPAPVVAVNPSPESERMAIFKLDAYVLIIRGKDRVSFVDGLSTNKIEGDCSTVFTTTAAKVIDMADVIDMFAEDKRLAAAIDDRISSRQYGFRKNEAQHSHFFTIV